MTPTTKLAAGLATGVAALAMTSPGQAQVGMSSYSLQGGFFPSPHELELTARGSQPASSVVAGCPGYADVDQPGFVVDFSDSYIPLRFYQDAEASPGLLVEGPDGIARCAATNDEGIAQVPMDWATDGRYELWPLSAAPGEAISVRLLIAEYELSEWELRPPEAPDAESLEPPLLATVSVDPMADDRQTLATGQITGSQWAGDLVQYCTGNVDPAGAHVALDLDGGADELSLYIEAEFDTVMMVRGPDGEWLCNDDTFGLDPAVTFSPAPAGRYHILGGTFSEGVTTDATFYANLGQPIWTGQDGLAVGAEPANGWVGLPGVNEEPVYVDLALSGSTPASDFDSACRGQIEPGRPDLVVDVWEDGSPLTIRAASDADTALLVVDPAGGITCIDDTYGLDPEVHIPGAMAGAYDVWVGAWGGGSGRPATVVVSRDVNAPIDGDRIGGGDDELGIANAPAFGWFELPLEGDDPVIVDMALTGTRSASDFDFACRGQIDASRPDLVVDVFEDGAPLAIRAASDADTALLVVDPDGQIICNDDTYGLDPEVYVPSAIAGEYAVWVGAWGGGGGRGASVAISGQRGVEIEDYATYSPDWEDDGWPNIFADSETALDVWNAIVADMSEFDVEISVGSIEERGPEALSLTDVTVDDIELDSPVNFEAIHINVLDVAGLRTAEDPAYIDIEIINMNYGPMARLAAMDVGVPLGDLDGMGSGLVSFALSVLPEGGKTNVGLSIDVGDQLGVGFDAIFSGETGGMSEMEWTPVEWLSLLVTDNGFVRDLITSQASQFGMSGDEVLAMVDEGLADAPFSMTEEDPRGALFLALRDLVAHHETGGSLTIDVTPSSPMLIEDIGVALAGFGPIEGVLNVVAEYTPH